MLRWILLLTIALLPLRGWVGDAMAVQQIDRAGPVHEAAARHEATSGEPVAVASSHDHASHDCMEDVQAQDGVDDSAPAADDGSCPTCAHCQACSAVALISTTAVALPLAFERSRPLASHARFASADRAQGLKPPIS